MNKIFSTLLLLCSAIALLASTADYNIVPLPQKILLDGKGTFVLDSSTTILCNNDALSREALFLQEYIQTNTSLLLPINDKKTAGAIRLTLDPSITNDEGYRIVVSTKEITIAGSTPAGVFYGIQCIRKALPLHEENISFPTGEIEDAPRFVYRGMMLDCARHIFPIDFIKEYIDLLALHNMNRFHWHLTDDQGWRIEIKKYPQLTEIGAFRSETTIGHNSQIYDDTPYGGFYTQEEAREIVNYAQERHITVIPEIDMPGHQQAALSAYPSLGCTGGPYTVGRNWGVYLNILCLGNEETYHFCEDVLSEIMNIFPSEYIHIGGDEAPKEIVANCPRCQSLMQREGLTIDNVQGYFTNRIENFLLSQGRHIIGWDEILDGEINPSAVIHCWRGLSFGADAAKRGHNVILSPTSNCYFDYYQADPTIFDEPQGIGGLLTVEQVFSLDVSNSYLSNEEAQHILGIQGNLWTEYIATTPHVLYMLLPRMAALSETQWCKEKTSFDDFLPRLTQLTQLYKLYSLPYARHLWSDELEEKDRDYM